tara:strand:- start:302738 stop:303514 length:777 start_codon:yes stop_codon:yes gene_type:complete
MLALLVHNFSAIQQVDRHTLATTRKSNEETAMNLKLFRSTIAAVLTLLLSTVAMAENSLPEVSHDGLHLMKNTKLRAVYMKPGANLDEYDKVALLACYVAFQKNWQRNYNDQSMDLMDRVTDEDMKNIRDSLAKEFNKVFTQVLTEGGHQMVTEGGSGVLIIQPAIVNLEVTAPDTMSPGEATISANAGQMTLYMQLHDGKTGDIIARIIDPEAVGGDFAEIRNSVTNMADAERVLRRWATILNGHLEDVTAAASSKK